MAANRRCSVDSENSEGGIVLPSAAECSQWDDDLSTGMARALSIPDIDQSTDTTRAHSTAGIIPDSDQYEHAPLDQHRDSIRLIQVHSDLSQEGLICISMSTSTVTEAAYTCLSYEWGSVTGGGWISINDKKHHVRQNLYDFLEIARKKQRRPTMWIDALCIDQENFGERTHQVQLMGRIYSEAAEVWTWLGRDPVTCEILGYIHGLTGSPFTIKRAESNRLKVYREHIRTHSYWKRAWITQEIMLARRVQLLAGKIQVDGRKFIYWHMNEDTFTYARRETRLRTLPRLLERQRRKQCHIPRDRIYSILALCDEGKQISANYLSTNQEVLRDVWRACKKTKTACICTPSLIAYALECPELNGGAMIPSHASFYSSVSLDRIKQSSYRPRNQDPFSSPLVTDSTFQPAHDTAGTEIPRVGNAMWLGLVCPFINAHIYWDYHAKPGSFRTFWSIDYSSHSPKVRTYTGFLRSYSTREIWERMVDIVIPRQLLDDLLDWNDDSMIRKHHPFPSKGPRVQLRDQAY